MFHSFVVALQKRLQEGQMNKQKKPFLSVIIPTYREETRIVKCIEESLFFFRNNSKISKFELLFLSDNAGDSTIQTIRSYARKNREIRLIANKKRLRKGGSVKEGMLKAKGDIMLFYDTDLSTPLYETNKFLDAIKKNDIVIASRGLKKSRVEKKFFKILLSRGFSLLKFLLLGITLSDTQCGFKMFSRKCLPVFKHQTIMSSVFDVEILFIAKKMGYSIKELPVTWVDSDMSNFTSSIILTVLKEIVQIKVNDLKSMYPRRHGRHQEAV